jgi:uncharacterized membrane protein YphA (DoxX/SURF4 family)
VGFVLAHEKWFSDARFAPDWGFLVEPLTLAMLIGAGAVAVLWRWAARWLSQPELPFLRPLGAMSPWIPRLLAIHAGVSLLAQVVQGTYLAPNLPLPGGVFGTSLTILEGLIGVWLIVGVWVRWPAALLVLAGPLGAAHYGPVAILERADLLGVALFLVILAPGLDRGGAAPTGPGRVAWATWCLRLMVGSSLIVVAFTEKLIDPALALGFLDRYPVLNLARTIGLPVSDLAFVRLAGAVEVLFGLLIVSGALPQLAVIAAGIPFNATLFFFGPTELIGHLPVYGAMLTLLVYGSDGSLARVVPALRPWRISGMRTLVPPVFQRAGPGIATPTMET